VLVQPSVYGWDNSYLCDCLERYTDHFAGVCLVNPRSGTGGADLRYWCRERGCRGVRVNLIADNDVSWLLGHGPEGIWGAAAELLVPVLLQPLASQAETLAELVRRWPTVTFVVDYLGFEGFHTPAGKRAIDLLATHANVYFKVLSVFSDSRVGYPHLDIAPLYEYAARAFGSARLLLGSDFPYVRQSSAYSQAIDWLVGLDFLDSAVADASARALWSLT
jgi:predicted TIM-barrel fold metal-dependent hydrolase